MSNKKKDDNERAFDPDMDMYSSMAHYLAEKLHIRPFEILTEWSVPELLVAYGKYANEEAQKNFNDWKNLEPKQRSKYPRPKEYVVYFIGVLE